MIDWQIHVKGKALKDESGELMGGFFSNETYQEYLLPFFDIGACQIDEYGSWSYSRDHIHLFIRKLKTWLEQFRIVNKEKWRVETRHRGLDTLETREICKILENAIATADKALEVNGKVVFFGD